MEREQDRKTQGVTSHRPSLRDLEFFRDFYEILLKHSSIKAMEREMKEKGWHGGSTFYYRKLAALEKYLRPTGASEQWRLISRSRGHHRAHPTHNADEFYRKVLRLLSHVDDTFAPGDVWRGEVTVAATNAMITYGLPFALGESDFLTKYPAVDLRVVGGEYWEVLDLVRRGKVTFGIAPKVEEDPPDCDVHLLMTLRRGMTYHPQYASFKKPRRGAPFDLSQLADKTVLLLQRGLQQDFDIESHLPHPLPGKGRRLYLPTFAQLRVWARHRLGAAIVHEYHVLPGDEYLPENERLQFIDLSDRLGLTTLYLYFRRGGKAALANPAAIELVGAIEQFAHKRTRASNARIS